MKFLGGNAARPFEQVSKYKFVYNSVRSKKKRIAPQHGVPTMKILKLSTESKSKTKEKKNLSAEKEVEK